jgi:hypothetical protein
VVGTAKPVIAGERAAHYEVVVGIHPQTRRVATLDPAAGVRQNSFAGFLEEWLSTGQVLLVVLPPAGHAVRGANAKPDAPRHTAAQNWGQRHDGRVGTRVADTLHKRLGIGHARAVRDHD